MNSRQGQALIESCIVIGLLCLVLMGVFQWSQAYMTQEILSHAAARAARCQAVGFNEYMVMKTWRIGTIATAGRLVQPPYAGGPAAQYTLERSRIPLYLAAEWASHLDAILDYSRWDDIQGYGGDPAASVTRYTVSQTLPLNTIFSNVCRAFYAGDSIPIQGVAHMDNHYPLYLEAP